MHGADVMPIRPALPAPKPRIPEPPGESAPAGGPISPADRPATLHHSQARAPLRLLSCRGGDAAAGLAEPLDAEAAMTRWMPLVTQPSADSVQSPLTDLEIKDAPLIFESVWQDLEADFGRENLRFPKEIILLGGAPGAGKGTNTAFIAKTRSLTCAPDRHERAARLARGEGAQGRRPHGRRPRGRRPAAARAAAPRIPRRRDHRRLPAHDGAGRVPEAAGRPDARAAARVLQHAAAASISGSPRSTSWCCSSKRRNRSRAS